MSVQVKNCPSAPKVLQNPTLNDSLLLDFILEVSRMLIERIASKVVGYLVKKEMIEDEKEYKDFYQYGAEITISSLLNIALILLIGALSNHLVDSLIYLLLFVFLRRFTGGYHADTYYKCNIIGCVNFSLIILGKDLSVRFLSSWLPPIAIGILSVLALSLLCPIENENKPIEEDKKPIYKLLSVLFGGLYLTSSVFLLVYHADFGFTVLYTLLSVAVSVIKSYAEKRICNEKEN